MAVTAGWVGSSVTPPANASSLAAAEQVAARFVRHFEDYSYRDPDGDESAAAALATPALATRLRSPSQGAPGSALVADKLTATATVTGFEVEGESSRAVELLARTSLRISTASGATVVNRSLPVALVLGAARWRVSGVGGLASIAVAASAPPSPPTRTTSATGAAPGSAAAAAAPGPPGPAVVGDIPPAYLRWMQGAVAARCPGLSWTVLAGIARVESDFGRSTLPGVWSGANPHGAEGPMQFEPATFAAYQVVAPGGAEPTSPYDPADAVYSAARLLCADGAGSPAGLYAAVFAYNHSDAYVTLVLAYADQYAALAAAAGVPGGAVPGLGSVIVADAESYLGTPYVWGGERPGVGFDCSGLVQWVYAEAGISLPRVAQDQYDAGPRLPTGAALLPGDLVFFGSGPSGVDHVGIDVGDGEMIDAPYTGADVRFDRIDGVALPFVGATRPEIPDLVVGAGIPLVDNPGPGAGGGRAQDTGAGGEGHPSSPRTSVPRPGGSPSSSGGGRHRSASPGSIRPRHHGGSTTTTSPTTSTSTTTTTPSPGAGRHHRSPATTTTSPTPATASTTTSTTTATTTTTTTTTSTATAAAGPTTTAAGEATTSVPPAPAHHRGKH